MEKQRSRKSTRQPLRSFRLTGDFIPPGLVAPEISPQANFSDFWLAAKNRVLSIRGQKLAETRANQTQFEKLFKKTRPIVHGMLSKELEPEAAIDQLRAIIEDRVMLRRILKLWSVIETQTPEDLERRKKEIAQRELELAASKKLMRAREAINRGLTTLVNAVNCGDEAAIKEIAELASHTTILLTQITQTKPEPLMAVIRYREFWPVLAKAEPGWEKDAREVLAKLGFGSAPSPYRTRFREARGADINLPARQWAKAAVRAIDETHFRCLELARLMKEFGGRLEFGKFLTKSGWKMAQTPKWWKTAVHLPALTKTTVKEWKPVIRELIRHELPKFHLRPEWETQRNSAAARERSTPGEIQNAILDDICSALERIAPSKELPKLGC